MSGHLLHIGYPKTGSTFLQRWFESHPQFAYCEGGIAGYRDVFAIARAGVAASDDILYRVTSSERLTAPSPDAGLPGESHSLVHQTDSVAAQLRVCATLASIFPNAVVLIVTRGFRSMILSTYSQVVRSGGDIDLGDLVTIALRGRGPEFEHLVKLLPWDYDVLISAYVRAFGAENVIAMPYELLRDDAAKFTRSLAARLGVDDLTVKHERLNQSLSPAELYWYPRLTRLMRRLPSRRLFALYRRAAFSNWLSAPIRLLQRLRPGTLATVPDELVNAFRGRAESLRGNPLYAPYASDYLQG